MIDGKPQQAAAAGKFVSFSDDHEFPHSVLDLSEVYAGQAGSAHRGIALLPSREVLIQDHLTGLQPGSRVRWGMISPGLPGDLNAPEVQLSQGDARLTLTIVSPSDPVGRWWRRPSHATNGTRRTLAPGCWPSKSRRPRPAS